MLTTHEKKKEKKTSLITFLKACYGNDINESSIQLRLAVSLEELKVKNMWKFQYFRRLI